MNMTSKGELRKSKFMKRKVSKSYVNKDNIWKESDCLSSPELMSRLWP